MATLVGDARIRELERRWKEGGGEEAEGAYYRALARAGMIDDWRLRLAANLGHSPALAAYPNEEPGEHARLVRSNAIIDLGDVHGNWFMVGYAVRVAIGSVVACAEQITQSPIIDPIIDPATNPFGSDGMFLEEAREVVQAVECEDPFSGIGGTPERLRWFADTYTRALLQARGRLENTSRPRPPAYHAVISHLSLAHLVGSQSPMAYPSGSWRRQEWPEPPQCAQHAFTEATEATGDQDAVLESVRREVVPWLLAPDQSGGDR